MKIKHISWRDGRPRFQPGISLRKRGYKGQDLKHEDGTWYSAAEAAGYSEQIDLFVQSLRAARRPAKPVSPATPPAAPVVRISIPKRRQARKGFVYFLRSGERIKIGFTKTPDKRLAALRTSTSLGVRSMVVVQGSDWHERRAHRAMKQHRQNGEWFNAHPEVIEMMQKSAGIGEVFFFTSEDLSHSACDTWSAEASIERTEAGLND